jgi:hypothetical protein
MDVKENHARDQRLRHECAKAVCLVCARGDVPAHGEHLLLSPESQDCANGSRFLVPCPAAAIYVLIAREDAKRRKKK